MDYSMWEGVPMALRAQTERDDEPGPVPAEHPRHPWRSSHVLLAGPWDSAGIGRRNQDLEVKPPLQVHKPPAPLASPLLATSPLKTTWRRIRSLDSLPGLAATRDKSCSSLSHTVSSTEGFGLCPRPLPCHQTIPVPACSLQGASCTPPLWVTMLTAKLLLSPRGQGT